MPTLYPHGQARPKKKRWHIVQSLFFIFVFSLASFIFLQSSVFSVREISVKGNKQLNREEVISLAGLNRGANIFKINLLQAREKLALHPMIQEVRITRDLPAGIVVELTERRPVAVIADKDGYLVISNDGCLLAKEGSMGAINLPFITGIKPVSAGPGQKINDERLRAALDYLLGMPLGIRAAVSEINVSDLHDIRMYTIDKVEVRFGDDLRVDEKIKLYHEVISRRYQDKIQYVDISYKGNPVIKFVEPQQQEPGQEP